MFGSAKRKGQHSSTRETIFYKNGQQSKTKYEAYLKALLKYNNKEYETGGWFYYKMFCGI